MSKIKVVNNIKSALGFNLSPAGDAFRVLDKQGLFYHVTEDELNYIHINQEIIQKGMLWIDDKETRVKLGLEKEDGTKENKNIIQYNEIVKLVEGHHKTLESALDKIDEPTILEQFVEVARDLEIDSVAKIKMIEDKSDTEIFTDDE